MRCAMASCTRRIRIGDQWRPSLGDEGDTHASCKRWIKLGLCGLVVVVEASERLVDLIMIEEDARPARILSGDQFNLLQRLVGRAK